MRKLRSTVPVGEVVFSLMDPLNMTQQCYEVRQFAEIRQ